MERQPSDGEEPQHQNRPQAQLQNIHERLRHQFPPSPGIENNPSQTPNFWQTQPITQNIATSALRAPLREKNVNIPPHPIQ